MKLRLTTAADLAEWPGSAMVTYGAPQGLEQTVAPAEVIVDDTGDYREVHVPWAPTEDDLDRLASGGTIWLTFLGAIGPHRMEVR